MEKLITEELGGIARHQQYYEAAYRTYLDACSGRQYYLQLLGEADSVVLRKLQEIHHNTHVIVVEPSEDYITEYKELVEHEPHIGRLTFDWLQQRAEEYFSQEAGEKCHLIHAIHVLYHVDDLARDLEEHVGLPGGRREHGGNDRIR
ncbi:hypothetical protein Bbelb_161990 [Branchiostoma belcheri]|nr:hypothetical protein Bbelb_161990 [Branchiostoma belcheri]